MKRTDNNELPAFLDLERWKRSLERKVTAFCLCGFLAGVGGLVTAYVAVGRDLLLVTVDAEGRPTLYQNNEFGKTHVDQLRVQYFAQEFVRKWEARNSANIDDDLTSAMKMMTAGLRTRFEQTESTYSARSAYKDANVRTLFSEMHAEVSDVEDEHKPIAVWVLGKKTYAPEFGRTARKEETAEWFYLQMKVNRVRMSKSNIFGLEVAWFDWTAAESREKLEKQLQARGV